MKDIKISLTAQSDKPISRIFPRDSLELTFAELIPMLIYEYNHMPLTRSEKVSVDFLNSTFLKNKSAYWDLGYSDNNNDIKPIFTVVPPPKYSCNSIYDTTCLSDYKGILNEDTDPPEVNLFYESFCADPDCWEYRISNNEVEKKIRRN